MSSPTLSTSSFPRTLNSSYTILKSGILSPAYQTLRSGPTRITTARARRVIIHPISAAPSHQSPIASTSYKDDYAPAQRSRGLGHVVAGTFQLRADRLPLKALNPHRQR